MIRRPFDADSAADIAHEQRQERLAEEADDREAEDHDDARAERRAERQFGARAEARHEAWVYGEDRWGG